MINIVDNKNDIIFYEDDNNNLKIEVLLNDEDVIVVTKNGMGIRFETTGIAPLGRVAAGVKSIKLKDGDEVITGLPVKKNSTKDSLGVFSVNGCGKRIGGRSLHEP